MPIINRIAEFHSDMKAWRQHLHAYPELQFDCVNTAAFVVERLKEFGITEIHEGIAETGIVAIIEGGRPGPTIGLRSDMDALPIQEVIDHPYKSQNEGIMHACGHDGHMTMLLGAARYLAETRNFAGRVALIFQPAEEGGGGGRVMVEEGIMDRFDISQVYAIHNMPNLEAGSFHMCDGPIWAAADTFRVDIAGKGGHGAMPEQTNDPIIAATQIVQAFQTIVSRNTGAMDKLVLSVTEFHSGTANNIIPAEAYLAGTVRTLSKDVQAATVKRMQTVCDGVALTFGLEVALAYEFGYPPTVNHSREVDFAADVARAVAGEGAVDAGTTPQMGAEDFSYMLEKRPGAYILLGQGESAALHHPEYNFNDEAAPVGASYFVKLVEMAQPL